MATNYIRLIPQSFQNVFERYVLTSKRGQPQGGRGKAGLLQMVKTIYWFGASAPKDAKVVRELRLNSKATVMPDWMLITIMWGSTR